VDHILRRCHISGELHSASCDAMRSPIYPGCYHDQPRRIRAVSTCRASWQRANRSQRFKGIHVTPTAVQNNGRLHTLEEHFTTSEVAESSRAFRLHSYHPRHHTAYLSSNINPSQTRHILRYCINPAHINITHHTHQTRTLYTLKCHTIADCIHDRTS
jgi:hypothetical protein